MLTASDIKNISPEESCFQSIIKEEEEKEIRVKSIDCSKLESFTSGQKMVSALLYSIAAIAHDFLDCSIDREMGSVFTNADYNAKFLKADRLLNFLNNNDSSLEGFGFSERNFYLPRKLYKETWAAEENKKIISNFKSFLSSNEANKFERKIALLSVAQYLLRSHFNLFAVMGIESERYSIQLGEEGLCAAVKADIKADLVEREVGNLDTIVAMPDGDMEEVMRKFFESKADLAARSFEVARQHYIKPYMQSPGRDYHSTIYEGLSQDSLLLVEPSIGRDHDIYRRSLRESETSMPKDTIIPRSQAFTENDKKHLIYYLYCIGIIRNDEIDVINPDVNSDNVKKFMKEKIAKFTNKMNDIFEEFGEFYREDLYPKWSDDDYSSAGEIIRSHRIKEVLESARVSSVVTAPSSVEISPEPASATQVREAGSAFDTFDKASAISAH